MLAALKRLVSNGYSVSPAKLIMDDESTTRAWTWTSSCSDPILSAVSSSATRTTSLLDGGHSGDAKASLTLEVLEVDILLPRWVARIGVTRSTQRLQAPFTAGWHGLGD